MMKNQIGKDRSVNLFSYVIKFSIILLTSAATIYLVKTSDHIHTPFFAAVAGAIAIGYVEPKMGWTLAVAQCGAMLVGWTLITGIPAEGSARRELETFAMSGSMLLTFAASFLGAFMKRAIDS